MCTLLQFLHSSLTVLEPFPHPSHIQLLCQITALTKVLHTHICIEYCNPKALVSTFTFYFHLRGTWTGEWFPAAGMIGTGVGPSKLCFSTWLERVLIAAMVSTSVLFNPWENVGPAYDATSWIIICQIFLSPEHLPGFYPTEYGDLGFWFQTQYL